MFKNNRDWSQTDHPFVPELIARAAKLRGMNKAHALMGLADAFWEEGEIGDAVTAIDKAKKISSAQGQLNEVAECDYRAAIYLRNGDSPDRALKRAQAARQIWVGLGNLHYVAECDGITAQLLARLGRHDEAIEKLNQAQAIFMEVGSEDDARDCIRLRTEICERGEKKQKRG